MNEDQVRTFIELAADEVHLATKVSTHTYIMNFRQNCFITYLLYCIHFYSQVVLIFGQMGALRIAEMCNVLVSDVERHGDDLLLITIPLTKNKQRKSFTIQGPFLSYVERYISLRPTNVQTDRFFLNYQKGKCTTQPIGINKFRSIPKLIAEFLSLPNLEKYTGKI